MYLDALESDEVAMLWHSLSYFSSTLVLKRQLAGAKRKKKSFRSFLHDKLLARQSIKDFDLHKYVDTE